jgi:hypothetical protein
MFCNHILLKIFFVGVRGAQARRVYKERKVGEAATLLQSLTRGVYVVFCWHFPSTLDCN